MADNQVWDSINQLNHQIDHTEYGIKIAEDNIKTRRGELATLKNDVLIEKQKLSSLWCLELTDAETGEIIYVGAWSTKESAGNYPLSYLYREFIRDSCRIRNVFKVNHNYNCKLVNKTTSSFDKAVLNHIDLTKIKLGPGYWDISMLYETFILGYETCRI